MVLKVVQGDTIKISEEKIYSALVEWGKHQIQKANPGSKIDYSALRNKIAPFLKFVRFSLMDFKQFANICKVDKILSIEEKYNIMMSLALNSIEFMPKEFAGASQAPRKCLL